MCIRTRSHAHTRTHTRTHTHTHIHTHHRSSPDETAFFRIYLLTEGTINNVLMIQPSLLAFSFNHPPGPVLLDVSSITPVTHAI